MNSIKIRKPLALSTLTMVALLLAVMFAFGGRTAPDPAHAAGQPSANLDQCRNGGLGDPVATTDTAPCLVDGPLGWVNGNAGAANAHFVEGHSIFLRICLRASLVKFCLLVG